VRGVPKESPKKKVIRAEKYLFKASEREQTIREGGRLASVKEHFAGGGR